MINRFEKEVSLANTLTKEAAALALTMQRRGVQPEAKADFSPVTEADRACERLIVDEIRRHFPGDGILGEEGANHPSETGRRWIIDPIDGTRDFVRGMPFWAVLIGFEQDGVVRAGAVTCPGQSITISAAQGAGAWSNDVRLAVAGSRSRAEAVLSINGLHKQAMERLSPQVLDWSRTFWAVRSLGGALDACLVALGKADVWIEPSCEPWDLAPFQIILEEAGCRFGSFQGRSTIYDGSAWACLPSLEDDVRRFLGI